MTQKIKIFEKEYDLDLLSETARSLLANLQSIENSLQERSNMRAVLTKAKKAYLSELKAEMLSAKAGFDFSD